VWLLHLPTSTMAVRRGVRYSVFVAFAGLLFSGCEPSAGPSAVDGPLSRFTPKPAEAMNTALFPIDQPDDGKRKAAVLWLLRVRESRR
jgi:hypothetical protein